MFSTPSVMGFNHQSQENNVASKPSVSTSTKKPLGDRPVNQVPSNEPKSLKVDLVKPDMAKDAEPKVFDYPEWLDGCSYKEVEDTYEDIWPKSARLSDAFFMKLMQPPKTPVPKDLDIHPMIFELPEEMTFKFDEPILVEQVIIDDVGFPNFDF